MILTVTEPIWSQFISDIILLHVVYTLRMKSLEFNKSYAVKYYEDRRREARLTLFYKIVKVEIAVSSEDIHLETADRRTRSTHKFKFKTKSATTSNLSNFVTHGTIKDRNPQPASVVNADSSCVYTRLGSRRHQCNWMRSRLLLKSHYRPSVSSLK